MILKDEILAKERVMLVITYLMLIFQPLSLVANLYNDRLAFSILYFFTTIATIVHLWCYYKTHDYDQAVEKIMLILTALFFTFFFIGEHESFDVFWVLIIPIVGMMLASLERLLFWLKLFLLLLSVMLMVGYFFPEIIKYETFALFSLLWAGIFIALMSYYYAKIKTNLENQIHHYQNNLEDKIAIATKEIRTLNKSLEETQGEIVERLGTLGEYRSKETGAHVRRVGLYSKLLAELSGLDKTISNLIEDAAPLHDIGKVGIPDSILNKPGNLTDDEYETMKKHTLFGQSILSGSDKPLIQLASEIAGGHHEKYDGSGYPLGIEGENIPLSARIVSIADVFDALISRRVYKDSWSDDETKNYFITQKNKHFDPLLTELFLEHYEHFVRLYKSNPDEENI
jgi:HD-GYP domain-containing protein (c-di-GMP phosphodiesterase class II)